MSRNVPGQPGLYTITTAAYLMKRGVPDKERRQWGSQFGRLAKRRFMELNNGREPGTVKRRIGQGIRLVFAYRKTDLPMLDEVWATLAEHRGLTL